jgi:tetratricopeptide (TPR) repeat protein
MDTAGQQAAAGDFDRAAATLERAVRIEPTNAALWHDLGEVRYRQGEFSQAESMAIRSNSLAGSEYRLEARNWRLIERARAGRGDLAGSDAAGAQALLIERRL